MFDVVYQAHGARLKNSKVAFGICGIQETMLALLLTDIRIDENKLVRFTSPHIDIMPVILLFIDHHIL